MKRGEITVVKKAFKFRIFPNERQLELINKTMGCSRFVFNFFRLILWLIWTLLKVLSIIGTLCPIRKFLRSGIMPGNNVSVHLT
ncbi:helix-turn-helix domain-containing protein [Alkalihalobacillus deserti]|uniref:helix-turn-helix domain-containing protein n=1 Tax=Alkalihalobacillus deserti TaxID=2879466 RepID=UPI001D137254|nr:helix-turn-helix domain-containing protein [Alkalihalobacillus deserti]